MQLFEGTQVIAVASLSLYSFSCCALHISNFVQIVQCRHPLHTYDLDYVVPLYLLALLPMYNIQQLLQTIVLNHDYLLCNIDLNCIVQPDLFTYILDMKKFFSNCFESRIQQRMAILICTKLNIRTHRPLTILFKDTK